MEYIEDTKKLLHVAQELALHEKEIRKYYLSQFSLQIQGEDPYKKLETLFYTQTKSTPFPNSAKSGEALSMFRKGITETINYIAKEEPYEAHKYFFEWLCGIPYIDQKIANLFIKFLVMFNDDFQINVIDFQSWKVYLDVPLDRWVLGLLWYPRLAIGTKKYNRLFSWGKDKKKQKDILNRPAFSYKDKKRRQYIQFQRELKEAISPLPSIILDNLWFVGYNFCTYDLKLCKQCWINKNNWCLKKEIKKEDYDQTI